MGGRMSEIVSASELVLRCAVLGGDELRAVVGAIEVEGEYLNGEYAFGLTLSRVVGFPQGPSSVETFYLASGDLPDGRMITCVAHSYRVEEDSVVLNVYAHYNWEANSSCSLIEERRLPVVCAEALARLDALVPQQAQTDPEFDTDVLDLLEECGFWPWSFHFVEPTTNTEY